jgi:hypothetical protein
MFTPESRNALLHAACTQGSISWPITLRTVYPFDFCRDESHLVEGDNVVAALLDDTLTLKDKQSAVVHYLDFERDRARRHGFRVSEAKTLASLHLQARIESKTLATRDKLKARLEALKHDACNNGSARGVAGHQPSNGESASAIAA